MPCRKCTTQKNICIHSKQVCANTTAHQLLCSSLLFCFRELNCFIKISVRDPQKILWVFQNSKLDPRNSILNPKNSKLKPQNSILDFRKLWVSRIKFWVKTINLHLNVTVLQLFYFKIFLNYLEAGLCPLWWTWKKPFDIICCLQKMKQSHWLLYVARNCDWSRKIPPPSNLIQTASRGTIKTSSKSKIELRNAGKIMSVFVIRAAL